VGGEGFAITVGFLREVVLAEAIGSGADAGREFQVFVHRQVLIPAVDLGVLLGYGPCRRDGEARVLVGEGAGRRFGLLVERVGDVVEASAQDFLQMPPGASTLPAACFRGGWCPQGRVVLVLDPEGLALLEGMERAEAAAVAPASGRGAGVP
jgi:chemotaxis signal transduction protein